MRMIGCGYRGWALTIMEKVKKWPGIDLMVLKSKEDVSLEPFTQHDPVLVLFYGWSWKVPEEITQKYLCLGLHPSRLPQYRGGSPLQNQIMNGEIESAVSIFKMTKEVDGGDLCAQVPFSLEGNMWEILDSVVEIASFETLRIVREVQNQTLKFWPQEGEATKFKRRSPDESEISQDELNYATARYLYNKIRGLQSPYPNAYIKCGDGKRLYLTGARCE